MSEILVRTALLSDLPVLRICEQGVIAAERPFSPQIQEDPVHYYDIKELVSAPHQISGLVLLAVMLVKMLVVPVVYLDHELRKDYIIATFCENKSRPQLHCDGKCYLAKRVAQAAREEQRQAENELLSKIISAQAPAYESITRLQQATFAAIPQAVVFNFHTSLNGQSLVLGIFRPPIC